jgi:hypothetical protein
MFRHHQAVKYVHVERQFIYNPLKCYFPIVEISALQELELYKLKLDKNKIAYYNEKCNKDMFY